MPPPTTTAPAPCWCHQPPWPRSCQPCSTAVTVAEEATECPLPLHRACAHVTPAWLQQGGHQAQEGARGTRGASGTHGDGAVPGVELRRSRPSPRYIRPAHGIALSSPLSHRRVAAMVRVGAGRQTTQFWGNFATFPPPARRWAWEGRCGGAAPRLRPANLPLPGSLSRRLTRTREKR